MTVESNGEAFKPSWIDRFINWVAELPLRSWIFYLIFGIVLILLQILFLWLDSGLHAAELLPVIIFNGLVVPYLLALIQLLDKQAVSALNVMRPVLDMTEKEFDQTKFSLSNMPFLAPLIAGLVMLVIAILTPLVAIEPASYAALEQLSLFAVVFHIIDKSSAFLTGVVLYHTIRQLRLVHAITTNHIRINLFHLRPVQAFSRLTASTALGLIVFVYLWMLINPELLADPLILGYTLLFTLLAVLVFVWPLWGVHRRIVIEKEAALQKIDQRFEELFARYNQHMLEEDYAAAGEMNGIIMSLEIQHGKISAIPTWPWRSETARVVLTAIALPLILMILQFFVQQALSR